MTLVADGVCREPVSHPCPLFPKACPWADKWQVMPAQVADAVHLRTFSWERQNHLRAVGLFADMLKGKPWTTPRCRRLAAPQDWA